MTCADRLTTQAYFDGEVDAVGAAGIERHVAQCADCRALLKDLEQTRAAIRNLAQQDAPPALRARILRSIDDAAAAEPSRSSLLPWRTRPFWFGAFGGAAGAAMAATLAWYTLSPAIGNPLLDDLMTAHVRSLMPSHLIDVASTDQHTVKPWFAGVYQHGPHVINVFSWAGNRRQLPADTTRNGYRMMFWQVGDLNYCAVSDTGWGELSALVHLLQQSSVRDKRVSN